METLPLISPDGTTATLSVVSPPQPRAVLLFISGAAIRSRLYTRLASALSAQGFAVGIVDLRGVGSSSVRASHAVDFGLREILTLDLPVAAQALRARFCGVPMFIGGHCFGGQCAALYLAAVSAAERAGFCGLGIVAAGSMFHRNWRGLRRYLGLLASALVPWLARLLGFSPSHLIGIPVRDGRTMIAEYSHNSRSGTYAAQGTGLDLEAGLASLTLPTLGISIARDPLAPPTALAHLLGKMPGAPSRTRHLELGLPWTRAHSGWTREPDAVAAVLSEWMSGVLDAG